MFRSISVTYNVSLEYPVSHLVLNKGLSAKYQYIFAIKLVRNYVVKNLIGSNQNVII